MIARWVRLWDRRERPQALALVRVLVGVTLLADLVQAGLFDAVGLVWGPPSSGAGYGQVQTPALIVEWLGASVETAFALWVLAVVACVLFTLGVAYRVSAWVLVFAMVELFRCQPVGDSIDSLLRIVLPVLAVSGAGACWSFDAWYRERRGKPAVEQVPSWPRYLIIAQLLWLYVSAGHQRDPKSWGPRGGFAAIGNVLGDPHFARFAPGSLSALYPLACLGTLTTMLFELSAPLYLVWVWLDGPGRGGRFGERVRQLKIRWAWLAAGVSLHLGIALSMKIGLFPFAILALYPAFLRPSEVVQGLAKVGGLLQRLASRSRGPRLASSA